MKYFNMIFLALLLISQTTEDVGVRETCRRFASGKYLNLQDKATQSDHFLHRLIETSKDYQKTLTQKSANHKSLRNRIDKEPYDAILASQYHELTSEVETLKQMIAEKQKLSVDAAKTHSEHAKNLERFKKSITGLFSIVKKDDGTREGVVYSLEYTESCPQFAKTCKLSSTKAMQLKKLTTEFDLNQSCQRYSSL
jgi:hypothetical protein